jgi:hypothetical protein
MLIHGHAEPARKHVNQPINRLGVKPTVDTTYHDPPSTRLLPKTISIIHPYKFLRPLPLPLDYDALPDFAFSRQFSNIAIHFENGQAETVTYLSHSSHWTTARFLILGYSLSLTVASIYLLMGHASSLNLLISL